MSCDGERHLAVECIGYSTMVDKRDLYTSIIALNKAAADAGQFEVAYHLLAAALHAAEVGADKDRMKEVIRLAGEQASAVDAAPGHPLSSANAKRRGNSPLYLTLVATGRGKLAQMQSHRVIHEHRSPPD